MNIDFCYENKHDGGPANAKSELELVAGDFPLLIGLDDIALFEVLEVREADTALKASGNLLDIFLEPLERLHLTLPDDGAFSQKANLGISGDDTVGDHATGDGADTRDTEDLSNLSVSGDHLFVLGFKKAEHCVLNILSLIHI